MPESFQITIAYQNNEREFDAEFEQFGFSYRVTVFVEESTIIFEPDEERRFRGHIRDYESLSKPPSKELVRAIGERLEEMFH